MTKRKITRAYIEGRSSYRALARFFRLDKNTVFKAVLEILSELVDSDFISFHFHPKWSGILSVDGKYIRIFDWSARHFHLSSKEKKAAHKGSFLAGVDVLTKDIPHHHLGDEETMIDLTMFFKTLKQIGYPLRVLITDGNTDIERAARHVYGDMFKVQLCHKHFIDTLNHYLKDERKEMKGETERMIENIRASIAKGEGLPLTSIKTETQEKILRYYQKNRHKLFLWTTLRGVPKTNNHIENLFRQLNLRLKTVNIFQTRTTAEKYLNALVLARRFTAFTDCKGRNKFNNGKAPLELAGCDIKDFDYLTLKSNSKFRR